MKLTFSPASPFARKVRIAAIELGLIDRIELVATSMVPGQFNEAYSHDVNPLRKLPVLILDDGSTVFDSEIIVEYLDELAGGKLFPPVGDASRWRIKTEHALTQGMLDAMLLCRYEKLLRPKEFYWSAWHDDQWERAWQGLAWFEARPDILARPLDIVQIALVCVLGYADFRFPDCGWRKAFPRLDAFNNRMMARDSVKVSVPPTA